ncbi:helix-turn-helix transcriptional regulator [Sphingorhabdus sp.]|jgi:DNA-binding XRE family transcriptional regulator|uniref:helix-turn-helix transcriptional regulator n=1 Tax=Sphingorhabdus sp. TaxID=1902408 RepID=UPI0037C5A50F
MVNNASAKLKAWRSVEGLTQAQAAKRFGVTRMTWFRWENGEIQPRGHAMRSLCEIINDLQPNDFFNLAAVRSISQQERQAA